MQPAPSEQAYVAAAREAIEAFVIAAGSAKAGVAVAAQAMGVTEARADEIFRGRVKSLTAAEWRHIRMACDDGIRRLAERIVELEDRCARLARVVSDGDPGLAAAAYDSPLAAAALA